MQEEFQKADNLLKKSENQKFETNPITKEKTIKEEYLHKTYNIQDRERLIDLVKFYSDWLYGPIDEELENKLYFIDYSNYGIKSPEEFFYSKLKTEFENSLREKEQILQYGIKIIEQKKDNQNNLI